jgi:hypothetical protein
LFFSEHPLSAEVFREDELLNEGELTVGSHHLVKRPSWPIAVMGKVLRVGKFVKIERLIVVVDCYHFKVRFF